VRGLLLFAICLFLLTVLCLFHFSVIRLALFSCSCISFHTWAISREQKFNKLIGGLRGGGYCLATLWHTTTWPTNLQFVKSQCERKKCQEIELNWEHSQVGERQNLSFIEGILKVRNKNNTNFKSFFFLCT